MRKLLLLFLSISLLLVVPSVSAQQNDSQKVEVTTLNSSETVNRNYFAANERVELDGTVNGDAFVAGGMVNVDGKVNGDLLVAGGEVNISGEVTDDVRVAGGQVRINGKVGKNLTVVGGNVEVSETASIGKSVVAVGGNVTLAAPIGGTINAGSGNLTIGNTVGGDVEVGVGALRLTSKAVVNGNLIYWSEDDAIIDQTAQVTGEIKRQTPPMREGDVGKDGAKFLGIIAVFALAVKIVNLVSWFLIGLLTLHFLPKLFDTSIKTLKDKPWPSLGIGFLTLVIVPILGIGVMLFVVGIPIGLILMGLWLIAIYLARIPVVYFIGEWAMQRFGRKPHQVWTLILGLVIYGVVTILPIIGGLVGLFATLFGLGAWILAKKEIYTEIRKKSLI